MATLVRGKASLESSETQCLPLPPIQEHCVTENGHAVAP